MGNTDFYWYSILERYKMGEGIPNCTKIQSNNRKNSENRYHYHAHNYHPFSWIKTSVMTQTLFSEIIQKCTVQVYSRVE